MSDEIKDNISDSGIWLRLVFMLLFTAIFCVIRLLLGAVIVVQFLWVLFTAERNDKLLLLANQLAAYVYQIYRYLSFNTEHRPFPFDDFPTGTTLVTGPDDESSEAGDAEETAAPTKPARSRRKARTAAEPKVEPTVEPTVESTASEPAATEATAFESDATEAEKQDEPKGDSEEPGKHA